MKPTSIVICQGSSCFSRGNNKNLKIIQDYIANHKINANVNIKGQLCSSNCQKGPVIIINEHVHEQVDEPKLHKLLSTFL
jgi:NADH:ubiquinone oxidoreductase subunit E